MAAEDDLHFITVPIDKEDSWCNKEIRELLLPAGMLAVAIRRGQSTILPKGNARLKHGDFLVLGAEPTEGDHDVDIREIV
ncbi:MAG: K+/H+ antiporter, partial [Lachnospiraceae bacterium]|nr:K+/H+ antiporter [Lachnospiraceae bacterium]